MQIYCQEVRPELEQLIWLTVDLVDITFQELLQLPNESAKLTYPSILKQDLETKKSK